MKFILKAERASRPVENQTWFRSSYKRPNQPGNRAGLSAVDLVLLSL